MIQIDENIEIDVYNIIQNVNEKRFGKVGNDLIIFTNDGMYKLEILKSTKVYILDEILIKLFEKLKFIIKSLMNNELNRTVIIFNNLSYELLLIIHRAAIISGIEIINFIDLNKSLRFYLDLNKQVLNESIALIQLNKNIEISIFQKNQIKRIFNCILNKEEINLHNLILKDELNEINNKNVKMLDINKIINKYTVKAYGIEEKLDKIYMFNNNESDNLNKISILGALHSYHFPKSKESIIIFNFIDYVDNYFLKELKIMKNKYKINQKRLEIYLDDNDIPFDNCFYKNIKIEFEDNNNNPIENLLKIHYNQKNFYCCTKDVDTPNSSEFIFFKNFPKITINDKYNVEIEEQFEENQIFKRINILNVNREKIKLNGNPLIYYNLLDHSIKKKYEIRECNLHPHILFLIGQNLNVLSYFNEDIFYRSSFIKDNFKIYLLEQLENIKLIENNISLENLKKNKKLLYDMISDCSSILNNIRFKNYLNGNILNFNQNDANLLIKHGKYMIFKKIFFNIDNNILDLSELNYKKFKKIYDSLNLFYEKCKLIEKDFLILSKIYNATCHMMLNYLENSEETMENIEFDLIQFDKDNIYKEANKNNIDLILNLTKNSFLYPYFLQFNSAFKPSQILAINDKYIDTCKTSVITLDQIKIDLIKSLPKYGLRIGFNTEYIANTILNTDITIYNEKKLFGHFLTLKELDTVNDINYTKRVKISFLQKHERFSHYKKYLNKSEKNFVLSPRGVINYEGDEVMALGSQQNIEKGELGESLEYIMTNGELYLIDNILNLKEDINLKELYEINSFLESDNTSLINKLKKCQNTLGHHINTIKENININIDDQNIINDIHKKKTIKENSKNKPKEIEDKNDDDVEFEKRKLQMIESNPIKKYTFIKNTIKKFIVINGKLIPVNNSNKKNKKLLD